MINRLYDSLGNEIIINHRGNVILPSGDYYVVADNHEIHPYQFQISEVVTLDLLSEALIHQELNIYGRPLTKYDVELVASNTY